MLCVCFSDTCVCLCACRFRGQHSLVLWRKDRGLRVQEEGLSFTPPAVAHRPCLAQGYGGTKPGAEAAEAGRGAWCSDREPREGGGPGRKFGRRERGQLSGPSWAPDGLQPLGDSPQTLCSPGDTSAPTTASLAALREWGGGSKIREKQFDVSNKASLHFAKLILTPIIICCRSSRVLPTTA